MTKGTAALNSGITEEWTERPQVIRVLITLGGRQAQDHETTPVPLHARAGVPGGDYTSI